MSDFKSPEVQALEDLARTQPKADEAGKRADAALQAMKGLAAEADLQAKADAARDEFFSDSDPILPEATSKIGGDEKTRLGGDSFPSGDTATRNQQTDKLRLDVYDLWKERDRLVTESLRLLALGADPNELEPIEGVSSEIWDEAVAKALNPVVTVTGNEPENVTGNDFIGRHKECIPKFIPNDDGTVYVWDGKDRGKDSNPKDAIGSRKAGLSMLPRQVLYEVALGMLEGALKYARHNYRIAGVRASVYMDANSRHMDAWWEGQDIDPGSGLHHVVKAIASLVVLRDSMLAKNWFDDRPPSIGDPEWMDYMNKEAERIIDEFEGEPKQPYIKGDNV